MKSYFNMSALNAVLAIRRYLAQHHEADTKTAIDSIKKIDVDYAANDYEAGFYLHTVLPSSIDFLDTANDLRQVLAHLIAFHQPWWIRLATLGRERLVSSLTREEAQCLRSAGLLDYPPSEKVVTWWDEITKLARSSLENRLLLQGRETERLSLAYERTRLSKLGIDKEPQWISIEDNTVGYDIRSYNPGIIEPTNRLIEVKSSTNIPTRIIVTRNEWDQALKYGDIYVFQIWSLPNMKFYERTVAQMVGHIPVDQGEGCWSKVEIDIIEDL